MSRTKSHIVVDGDMPMHELLRLLGVRGDSVTLLIPDGTIEVRLHARESVDHGTMTFEEKKELARSALGGWDGLIDLDELKRQIYEGRDQDPIKPPVVLD
jgi:hypothetical protein